MDKNELRKEYLRKRNAMAADEVKRLSGEICEKIESCECFKSAEYMYAYYPLGNEVDIRPLVQKAWEQGKHVAFPRTEGNSMRFFETSNFEEFSEGAFHVQEPPEDIPAEWKHALVIVPGVVFDRNGNRMGYGKGFYDRFLEGKTHITLAAAYELQLVYKVPCDKHDVPLDCIVTEKEIYR